MRVFLLDATLHQPTEVRFLLFTETETKLVLTTNNTRRHIHVVPVKSISEEWIEHVLFLLKKHSNGGMSRDFTYSVVNRRYMLSSGTLTAPTDVLHIICSSHLEFSKIESSQIAAIFGLTTSLLEHTLIENELRGWLEFDSDSIYVTQETAKVYSTINISACLKRSEEQPPQPRLRSIAVYRHNDTSFAYLTQDGKFHDDWLEASELSRAVTALDPAVICVHGRQTLVGVVFNFPYVLVDTVSFVKEHKICFTKNLDDAVPIVEEKKPIVVEEDEDLEPIHLPARFPGKVGKERCAAIFSIVQKTNAIDLTLEVAMLTGQPWSQTLRLESRLNRVEWMIMTFFHQHNCVIPDPRRYSRPIQYTAGLVLDAKVGIHQDVILLDFRSLYPSVVVEYNLCWSTDGIILPTMLEFLIDRRQALAGQPGTDVARLCLKLLANMTYGALAYPAFRFYSPEIASTITAYGRKALQATVSIVEEQFSCDVIYGDTDSVFVTSSQHEDCTLLAKAIVAAVNTNYRKLELEFDGFYSKLLLLGKKCYIGYKSSTDTSPVVKGLKIIKRQYFAAGKEVCRALIDILRTASSADDYENALTVIYQHASDLVDSMHENKISRADLTIVNMLSKRMVDYGNVNIAGLYHVIAAKASRVRYEKGDYVQYIMFQGCTPIAIDQIDDLPSLPIDIKWYCASLHSMLEQILKVLPINNFTSLTQLLLRNNRNEVQNDHFIVDEPRSAYAPRKRTPLIVSCVICQKEIEHWGLAKIDAILQQSKCDTILHWSPRVVFPDRPLSADIFYTCSACHCSLDLLGAARQLTDIYEIASVHSNYDCKKTARQIDCDQCRRNLLQFFTTSGVMQKFNEVRDELYLRIS